MAKKLSQIDKVIRDLEANVLEWQRMIDARREVIDALKRQAEEMRVLRRKPPQATP